MGFLSNLFGGRQSSNLSVTAEMLSEEIYWKIIEDSLLNSINQDDQEEYLLSRLKKLDPKDIVGFKLRTDQLLTDTYTSEMWCAGYVINEGCSDDSFEYFRLWIISRGKVVFNNAKSNPDSLITEIRDGIDDYDFESFNSIPDDAFESRTSKDIYDYIDEVGFAKVVGKYPEIDFNWEEDDPNSMKTICPRLFERMWK